jgi:hypothetical protein
MYTKEKEEYNTPLRFPPLAYLKSLKNPLDYFTHSREKFCITRAKYF